MFQFLIGTLKTLQPANSRANGSFVSIPHRYAKNSGAAWSGEALKKFQFLIGTLKTKNGEIVKHTVF